MIDKCQLKGNEKLSKGAEMKINGMLLEGNLFL